VTAVATIRLPEDAEIRLRAPDLKIVAGQADDAKLIAVTATLSWQNVEGQRVVPVTLTAWRRGDSPAGDAP
jgi:hypothetical protein